MKRGNRRFAAASLALVAFLCVCCLCASTGLVASVKLGVPEQLGLTGNKSGTNVPGAATLVQPQTRTTSTPVPIPPLTTALPGVLFHDDFGSKAMSEINGWGFGKTQTGTEATWSPNKLTMTIRQVTGRYDNLRGTFQDLAIEIEAQPTTEAAGYGVFFRSSQNGDACGECYTFYALPNGQYSLFKIVNSKSTSLVSGETPYINQGIAKNRLGIVAEGSTLSLYANGRLLKTVTDDSLSSGSAGIVAVRAAPGDQTAEFNRVTILTPQRGKAEFAKADSALSAALAGVLFYDDFASESLSKAKTWPLDQNLIWSANNVTLAWKGRNQAVNLHPTLPVLNDFGAELEAQPDTQPDTQYGIAFRIVANDTGGDYYSFAVTQDGEYSLMKRIGGTTSAVIALTPSQYIKTGAARNRLGVLAEGPTISLFINGTLVARAVDNGLASGAVGLFLRTGDQDAAQAMFSSFAILTAPRAEAEWASELVAGSDTWFDDDFSSEQRSKENGWVFSSSNTNSTTWSTNQMKMEINQKGKMLMNCVHRTFQDFAAEVQAQPGSEEGTEYGIVFRMTGNPSNYYMYGARNDGRYYLVNVVGGTPISPALISLTPSRNLTAGATKNRLGVIAAGPVMTLYANGQPVQVMTDTSITSSGSLCLFVQAQSDRAQVQVSRVTVLSIAKAQTDWNPSGILFQDDFSSEQGSKDHEMGSKSDADADWVWSRGRLAVTLKEGKQDDLIPIRIGTLKDYGIEMEAQPLTAGWYGLVFGLSGGDPGVTHYLFSISTDGDYTLGKKVNGKWLVPDPIPKMPSPFARAALSKNRLGVLVDGSTISLYINGNLVRTVTDAALPSGLVTLYMGATNVSRPSIAFTRVTVYTVEKARTVLGASPEAAGPQVTATTPSGILFQDDFGSEQASKAKGWIFGPVQGVDAVWSPNKFTMSVSTSRQIGLRNPGLPSRTDFGVQVEGQPEDRPGTSYGIIFRLSETTTGRTYYLYSLTVDGKYSLQKKIAGQWSDTDPVSLTSSPLIRPGASMNRLGVLAEGSNISLYINGSLVKTITDDSISNGGVALAVITGETPLARVTFSRVTVYTVEQAKTELSKP